LNGHRGLVVIVVVVIVVVAVAFGVLTQLRQGHGGAGGVLDGDVLE